MLPKTVVDEKVSRFAPGPGENMIARRYHKDGTTKNWFASDERVMIPVI
jgi:hypothetical protein